VLVQVISSVFNPVKLIVLPLFITLLSLFSVISKRQKKKKKRKVSDNSRGKCSDIFFIYYNLFCGVPLTKTFSRSLTYVNMYMVKYSNSLSTQKIIHTQKKLKFKLKFLI